MTYIFESGLAHHIEGLIQQKRADGYAYNSEEKLPIRQAGLQAHTKSANLGAARCFQWTRYIAAQCSAYPLTGCGKFPLLFLPL